MLPISHQTYPPEIIQSYRTRAIGKVRKKTILLLLLFSITGTVFLAFAVISLTNIISGRDNIYNWLFLILNTVFLIYDIHTITSLLRDSKKKIAFFKHPGTDPFYIINGIYPSNKCYIEFQTQQPPYNGAYNANDGARAHGYPPNFESIPPPQPATVTK